MSRAVIPIVVSDPVAFSRVGVLDGLVTERRRNDFTCPANDANACDRELLARLLRVACVVILRRCPLGAIVCDTCARAVGRLTMDWYQWHRGYDESTALRRRLEMVQRHIVDAVDRASPGPFRVLSICAGDGRDLIGAFRDHPRRNEATVTLVEEDARLVEHGCALAIAANLSAQFHFDCTDATRGDAYDGRIPCELTLACGVVGNLAPDTTPAFIRLASAICDTGGSLIWTRRLSANNDASPAPLIRELLAGAGFEEVRADLVEADDGDPEHLRNEFGAGRFLVASHVHRGIPAGLPRGKLFSFVGFKALSTNR